MSKRIRLSDSIVEDFQKRRKEMGEVGFDKWLSKLIRSADSLKSKHSAVDRELRDLVKREQTMIARNEEWVENEVAKRVGSLLGELDDLRFSDAQKTKEIEYLKKKRDIGGV